MGRTLWRWKSLLYCSWGSKVNIDWSLNIGQIITGVGLLVGAIATWIGMKHQVSHIVFLLEKHEERLDEYGNKIEAHEKQINIWRGRDQAKTAQTH
jgi:hypothetical protein